MDKLDIHLAEIARMERVIKDKNHLLSIIGEYLYERGLSDNFRQYLKNTTIHIDQFENFLDS